MTQVAEIKSPHEQRLEDNIAGKEDIYRESHKRVFKLLERFDGQNPAIDVERALFFTQSMAETVGQPLVLRWAKALMNVAKNITVMVQDDQLLLGRCGGHDGRYGILYPELDGDFLDIAVRDLPSRQQSPAVISPEDARIVMEQIAPYWKGRTYHEALNHALPPEVHKLTYCDPEGLISRFVVNETSSFRSSIQWVHDYEKILKRGFNGIRAEAEARLAALDPSSPVDQVDRRPFLEAVIIVSDAIVLWARRYAARAREVAAATVDPVRRAELLKMAEIADKVPAEPATSFYEAVQSQWFVQMFSRLEQKTGTTISNGRMDQYFYPYYKKDMEEGVLTEEKAMELLECMWVGMAEFIDMYISPQGGAFNEGYAHWEAVTIGDRPPTAVTPPTNSPISSCVQKESFLCTIPTSPPACTPFLPRNISGTWPKPSSTAPAFPSCATTRKWCLCTCPRAPPLKRHWTMPFPAAPNAACPTATPTLPAARTSILPRLWKCHCAEAE